tara:strand:+ start:26662 stop:27078 length:417 start_codon:yes stop_codon:yes gene_type:complete
MRFMLVFYMPEATWVSKDLVRRVVAWKRYWTAAGIYETGNPLKPPGMTHTLSLDGAKVKVTEGPLHDHNHVFYAFEIIKCETLEIALDVARSHPALEFPQASVEVREVWEDMDPDMMGEEYDDISAELHEADRKRMIG